MARNERVWYPGAIYHIVSRGNRKKKLFLESDDYNTYLNILKRTKGKLDFSIFSYCLMSNHVHLQIQTKKVEIWKIMHQINLLYAKYFNCKYDFVGHVFQGRYRSKIIEDDYYNISVNRYIHLNPVEAAVVSSPEKYTKSSYKIYLGKKRNNLINVNYILSYFNNNRNLYKKYVESTAVNKELDKAIKEEIDI
ncbi:MAG: transposase [Bacillota bacterium]